MTFVFKIFAKNILLVKKNVHENVVYCKAVYTIWVKLRSG